MRASPADPLKVCFLVQELGRSGGVAVIEAHAAALAAHPAFEPEIVITDRKAGEVPDRTGEVPVRQMPEARATEYDLAIATWWTTAGALYDVSARRRAVLLQSIETRFYPDDAFFERLAAAAVLTLPVDFIVVASWMRELVAELRPDARCLTVRNGVDKDVFRPRSPVRPEGALRVLVEGQPDLWFKGVHEAVAAVRAMQGPAELAVVALDPAGLEAVDADRRLGGLDPEAMATLYAENDVLLKLSRVESLGLPPLEAMHVGRPCVLTPYTGHEEYAVHGGNSLVVGFDDLPATTSTLEALARDRGLLVRLSDGALETAEAWPSAHDSSQRFCEALLELAEEPPPPAAAALPHLVRAQRGWTELGREHVRRVRGALAWREHQLEALRAHFEEVNAHRAEIDRQLRAIRSSRPYRLANGVRRLVTRRAR